MAADCQGGAWTARSSATIGSEVYCTSTPGPPDRVDGDGFTLHQVHVRVRRGSMPPSAARFRTLAWRTVISPDRGASRGARGRGRWVVMLMSVAYCCLGEGVGRAVAVAHGRLRQMPARAAGCAEHGRRRSVGRPIGERG